LNIAYMIKLANPFVVVLNATLFLFFNREFKGVLVSSAK
jgi:hypothetical protein